MFVTCICCYRKKKANLAKKDFVKKADFDDKLKN